MIVWVELLMCVFSVSSECEKILNFFICFLMVDDCVKEVKGVKSNVIRVLVSNFCGIF